MDKELLEAKIFEKNDDKLLDYLEENFCVKKVTYLKLLNNLNTYKSMTQFKKQLLNSRLISMEEGYDQTAIFAIIVAFVIGLLGAYNLFLETLFPEKWMSTLAIVLAYAFSFIYCAYQLGHEKGKRKKVKYYLSLFKEN